MTFSAVFTIHQGNGEFSLEILKDLVAQGYSGDDLVHRFEGESKNIRKAIGVLLEEAEQLASGEKPAATFEDIFGTENFYEELKRLYKK